MSSIHTGPTQIQYTIFSKTPYVTYDEFYISVFQYIQQFPRDLLQLDNSEKFFKVACLSNYKKGLNIFSFPAVLTSDTEAAVALYRSYCSQYNQDIVHILLIDSALKQHKALATMLRKIPHSYFVMFGEAKPADLAFYDTAQQIDQVQDFIRKVETELPALNQLVKESTGYEVTNLKIGVHPLVETANPRYPTHLAETNFYLLNQILGNFWKDASTGHYEPDREIQQKRVPIQIAQIQQIDNLYREAIDGVYLTPIEPELPPLIISAPYHFPGDFGEQNTKKLSQEERDIKFVMKGEQQLDYSYRMEAERMERLGKTGHTALGALTMTLMMLDKFAYLHAQLSHSPYFRLPVIGRSINGDLSHFLRNFPFRQNAVEKIQDFGDKLQKQVLATEFRDFLITRNGQLVVVSDLPVEWLKLGQYPLVMTHDICRVPEVNINSLLNNYIHNQRIQFRIKHDILSKTLVLHCAGENEQTMRNLFAVVDRYKNRLGFNSATCTTISEVKAAIEKYKPELLIFDCHGSFDKKLLSSYLIVDNSKKVYLTGELIIKHAISAPLVFISACSTAPNYGFVKQLSDAFFQAGAMAVTATYLPIAMKDATKLIVRLLEGLKQHEKNVYFHNWLAFVSHTLRSTIIYDAIHKEVAKKRIPADFDKEKIAEILRNLMVFNTRLKSFEQVKTYLKQLNPKIDVEFSNLDNEWLSYTTMGRADLIYFDNWDNAHRAMHLGEDAVD